MTYLYIMTFGPTRVASPAAVSATLSATRTTLSRRLLHRLLLRLPQAHPRHLRRVRTKGVRRAPAQGHARAGRLLVHRLARRGLLARLPRRAHRLAHPPARRHDVGQVGRRARHPLPHGPDDGGHDRARRDRQVRARGRDENRIRFFPPFMVCFMVLFYCTGESCSRDVTAM